MENIPAFTFDEMLFDSEIVGSIDSFKLFINEPQTSFRCHLCNKEFTSKIHLNHHHHESHDAPKETFCCKICGETFSSFDGFTDHNRQHEINTCLNCKESFPDRVQLIRHQEVHRPPRFFSCNQCGEDFRDGRTLKEHFDRCNKKERLNNQCDICFKHFSTKSNLRQHAATHKKKKRFRCKICRAGFTQNVSLERHYLGHLAKGPAGVKPFACTLCDKSFTHKRTLEAHAANHQSEPPHKNHPSELPHKNHPSELPHQKHPSELPHQCLVCDKRFETRQALKKHGMEHMPGQKSACDVCMRWFATVEKRNQHSVAHVYPPPFQCDDCERGFRRKAHLKRHMSVAHSSSMPFVCELCGESYKYKHSLTKHRMDLHDIEEGEVNDFVLPTNVEMS